MNTGNFFVVLITITYITTDQCVVSANDNTGDSEWFSNRIQTLQDETGNLCSYIEGTSRVRTKTFIRLMQDAHRDCPDMKRMEVTLANIATQADTYYSYVTKQSSDCEDLLFMLTKSSDNGGLVDYYLNEGNYSLVTSSLDKWHQKFLDLKSKFDLTSTPLDIMLNNKKIFFYDNWIARILQFGKSWIVPLIILVGLLQWLTWMGFIFWIIEKFSSLSTIIVWFTVLFGLIVITPWWYSSKISLLPSSRVTWYSDAVATLEKMRADSDKVQSDVTRQIGLIKELQSDANKYHDENIKMNVDELLDNFGTGLREVYKETSQLFIVSEKYASGFRQAYKSIEAKAEKARRLVEAQNLLVVLNETSEMHERCHRSLQILMIHQRKVLPMLKDHARTMQVLAQQGHVMEIGRIINHDVVTVMEIDGHTLNVSIVLKQLIKIGGNDDSARMKKIIEELKDQTVNDQFSAKVLGTALGLGGTVSGLIAFKSGYILATITATAVAGPVATVVGVGLWSGAAYSVAKSFENYNDASRYSTELDILETLRENVHTEMKNVEKAFINQETASNRIQTTLSNIATNSASFSNNTRFRLPVEKRSFLSNELLRIMQEYNVMIGIFNSLETYMIDDDHIFLL